MKVSEVRDLVNRYMQNGHAIDLVQGALDALQDSAAAGYLTVRIGDAIPSIPVEVPKQLARSIFGAELARLKQAQADIEKRLAGVV